VTKRKLFIALAAAGLVASVVAGREKPAADIVEPAARIGTPIRDADATRIRAGEDLDLSKLERPADEGAKADLFANPGFSSGKEDVAGRKAEKTGPPPLPFAYLGKLIEDGKLAVFLSRGDESLSVAQGDTIGEYRVDAVTESEITFTYLPLKAKQKLPL
jgi:hypothetical protein